MTHHGQNTVDELRHRAERALTSGRLRETERLLDELAVAAPEGSEPAFFAHRHLAELHLERNPWRAATHLRKVMGGPSHGESDVLHALMGLCQALLGNYHFAASCYRRALGFAPKTPWYHHNLGHLLDVALHDLPAAERHLRLTYEAEPHHDEIVASLAHCLGRRGRLEEAARLAREASHLAPDRDEHRKLLAWIEDGAPEEKDEKPARENARAQRLSAEGARARRAVAGGDDEEEIDASVSEDDHGEQAAALLVDRMIAYGFDPDDIHYAQDLLDDYLQSRPFTGRPTVLAAAVEYTVSHVRGLGWTQRDTAERYGVTRGAVGHRFRDIRETLALR